MLTHMQLLTHMRAFIDPNWWTIGISALVQFVLFLRWLYRRIRNEDMNRTFLEDMALHHLPHIYELLAKLAEKQGIDHSTPPPIRWIDLNLRQH